MPEIEKEYFECDCHAPEHLVTLELIWEDVEEVERPEPPMLCLHTQPSDKMPFWYRLKEALKYLFRIDQDGWSVTTIKYSNIPRLKAIVDRADEKRTAYDAALSPAMCEYMEDAH